MFWLFNYFQNKRFLVYSCKRKKENLPSNELLEINLQFDEFENFRRLRSVVDETSTTEGRRFSSLLGSLIFYPGKSAAVPIPLFTTRVRKNTPANSGAISTRHDRFTWDIFRFCATLDDENTSYFPTSYECHRVKKR